MFCTTEIERVFSSSSSSPERSSSRTVAMRYLIFLAVLIAHSAQAQQQQQQQELSNRKIGPVEGNSTQSHISSRLPTSSITLGVLSVVAVAAILLLAGLTFIRQRFFASPPGTKDWMISAAGLQPVQFSLKSIAAATNNFSERIGTGILGSVYKGLLPDNKTDIVVKKLNNYNGSDKEFRSFISEVGLLSHATLPKLYGYCSDHAAEKMLIYEFVPNGSLDKLLFEGSGQLDWNFRYATALSIARGIEYLHQQQFPVVHGNLKAENVLLDINFQPKISDTGLSSLVDRKRLKMALTNEQGGVHGYFSPEWISDSALTTKSDIYGFGMVLLEIIGGRRVVDLSKRSDQWNFVEWTRRQVKTGKYEEIVDPEMKFDRQQQQDQVISVIDVALCCIQEDAKNRPSMSKVVEMLCSC